MWNQVQLQSTAQVRVGKWIRKITWVVFELSDKFSKPVYNVTWYEGLFPIFSLFISSYIHAWKGNKKRHWAFRKTSAIRTMGACCDSFTGDRRSIAISLQTEETERFVGNAFHSSTCLASQQLQIKSRQDRGTIKCPTSSAFSSSVLQGEVDSSDFFSFCQAYFWETTFTAFTRKCHYASGAGKEESNFITVKCLTPHYPP